MSPNISRLRATAVLARLQENRIESPYNVLNRIASHGDPLITEVSLKMRDKSMEGIESMIKSWASIGEVDDLFSEFFVQCKRNVVVYLNPHKDTLLGEAEKLEKDVDSFPRRVMKQSAGEAIDRREWQAVTRE
jgi:hypothetical protein